RSSDLPLTPGTNRPGPEQKETYAPHGFHPTLRGHATHLSTHAQAQFPGVLIMGGRHRHYRAGAHRRWSRSGKSAFLVAAVVLAMGIAVRRTLPAEAS